MEMGNKVKLVAIFEGGAELPFKGEIIFMERPIKKRLWDWEGWKGFAKVVKTENPDIVQANAGDTLKFAILSKLIFRWKVPVVFRNASTISEYINSLITLWFNRFLFRKTSFVVSVSESSRQDFLRLFPFIKGRIEVIPIGIDSMYKSDVSKKREYLLHVGGFTFEKNHFGLIKIMKRLVANNPSLNLWLIGDGPLRESMQKLVYEMNLQENIRFLGYQKNVMDYMGGARVLLLPSKIEGLPGVILEAMYCHTPVVAYNVGGISEIVLDKKTGWLVEADDEDGFVLAVQSALMDCDTPIVKSAHKMVVDEFNNQMIATRFMKVYKTLIK